MNITEEHYDDLLSNAAYRKELSKFLVNIFCLGVGIWFGTVLGFVSALLLYMNL